MIGQYCSYCVGLDDRLLDAHSRQLGDDNARVISGQTDKRYVTGVERHVDVLCGSRFIGTDGSLSS